MRRRRPTISIARAVEVFETMVDLRRRYCGDKEFFTMIDVFEILCDEDLNGSEDVWRIKTFSTNLKEEYRRKVGVITFDGNVTLSMDQRFLDKARQGCNLCNYTLAHEFGHLALEHHNSNAKIMNFQLFDGQSGNSNLPPNSVELEANYAAVFFQCGDALTDDSMTSIQLARRSYSDFLYVKKAQKIVRLPEFQRILNRPKPQYPRILL